MDRSARQRHLTLAVAATAATAAAAAGVWVLRHVDPNAAGSPLPGCMFYHFTGLYCPGCGMTRALHALAHGDLAQMMAMNPLLGLLIPALPLLVLQGLGYRLPLPRRALAILGNGKAWLGLLAAFWVLRNLPWPPFSWLAPG
ncbi:DUF2752 domain-containing protein [Lysobacter gummosus]|jgi:hypothetical protein|uniref:DUF2752 domain-containing protein n=1 Tax=Lysobacter gummosus TaxID=262324 RepID=A0ABY3XFE9_9GAMM|nr:DUF2752 domain-containing protein [Lysobacter gummosus]ALN89755.1 hypothetical protein LG3211_0773 [Lysobacter gummosus]UNP30366.1 DUF2752 domain-containing protein [Lysobacter gummosus]